MTHPELPLYVWNEPGPHAKHPVAPATHAYLSGRASFSQQSFDMSEYKVGDYIPSSVLDTYENFTFARWRELGRPLCAIRRSQKDSDGKNQYSLARFYMVGPYCTDWVLEDVAVVEDDKTLMKRTGDWWAVRGSVKISPYPDTRPYFGHLVETDVDEPKNKRAKIEPAQADA